MTQWVKTLIFWEEMEDIWSCLQIQTYKAINVEKYENVKQTLIFDLDWTLKREKINIDS